MDATELRIGNLVYGPLNREGKILSVYMDSALVNLTTPASNFSLKDLTAIPITEEWLLKFGFEKDSGCYEKGPIMYLLASNTVIILAEGAMIKMGVREHLHQIQNLYFDLTGKELTLQ